MSLSNLPTIRPSLLLDFQKAEVVDSRVTFTRASTATRFNSYGVLESVANNVPRIDFNPTTLVSQGLLIEEQRTNSIRNNTMQGAVAGTPGTLPTNWNVGSASGLTTNVIGTGTEAGVNYVDIQFVGTPTATAYTLFFDATSQIAALNAQTWSSSLWCKIAAGTITNITSINNNITYRDSGGTSVQSARTAMSLTSAFTRYAQAGTATSASTAFVQSGLWFTVTVGAAIDITLRIGLPQLEQGAFATSVIPTTTTVLTRNADVASMTGTNFSSWYNASEGVFLVQAQRVGATTANSFPRVLSANDGSLSNEICVLWWTSPSRLYGAIGASGSGQADIGYNGQTQTNNYKTALAYKTNDFAFTANAQAVQTDTSGTVPTVNRLAIGNVLSTDFLNGYIQRLSYYPVRLPNSTLQALTST